MVFIETHLTLFIVLLAIFVIGVILVFLTLPFFNPKGALSRPGARFCFPVYVVCAIGVIITAIAGVISVILILMTHMRG